MVDLSAVRGGTAYDSDGDKIGSVDEVYTDEGTGDPSFVTVRTGLSGTRTTFVPLADASVEGSDLRLPHQRSKIEGAPSIDPDAEITEAEQERLYRHYGLGGGGDHDTSGPTADDATTRSRERLRAGTRTQETGRVRMRKHVTTEHVGQDVPVSHEEARVTREPITDANRDAAYAGPEIAEGEYEVTLHGERPVAEKEVVPVERVRVGTETVRGTERVSADLREEHVEVDGADVDGDAGTRRR